MQYFLKSSLQLQRDVTFSTYRYGRFQTFVLLELTLSRAL